MMIDRDRETIAHFARAVTQSASADIMGEELPWRLAETFGWNTPSQEAHGLRILSMTMLMLSLDLRARAEWLEHRLGRD